MVVPSKQQKLRFFYIKNSAFRVFHVDGALGGITPRGFIHAAVYSERPAIPQSTDHDVSAEGSLSEPTSQEGKEGIVREIDADLIMSKLTAIQIRDWLDRRIAELEELELAMAKAQQNMDGTNA